MNSREPTDGTDPTVARDFGRDGFAVVRVHSAAQVELIREFAVGHVARLIAESTTLSAEDVPPIYHYHEWCQEMGADHGSLLTAKQPTPDT